MSPHAILHDMSKTFEERGKVYGDNWRRVGPVLEALFGGEEFRLQTADDHLRFNLFELIVTKLTRLAVAEISHIDSAHDIGVYAAMLESAIREQQRKKAVGAAIAETQATDQDRFVAGAATASRMSNTHGHINA